MKLRGIEFGNILGASGVQGFFGEGYWFHELWRYFGLDFDGMTFTSKTATLNLRKGNMPLDLHYAPINLFPMCIKTKWWRGIMLNAVGLSNPGLQTLLDEHVWQTRIEPFMISIMLVEDTPEKRREELEAIVESLASRKGDFQAPYGLQINISCPNTGLITHALVAESTQILEIAGKLGVPLMLKISIASFPTQAVMELNAHPDCDAICVSNTLPFGWRGIDWEREWGSSTSPLQKFGGGGLSGAPLRRLVCVWIAELRDKGFTKPINGGGGILSVKDVSRYHEAGASSVFIGSVAALRPWRVSSIIAQANKLDWRQP